MDGNSFIDYKETELDKLKSDVVNLDNNVEQYDKQIKRCEDTIKDLEDSLNDLATELSNAATQVERDRINKEIHEKEELKRQQEEKKKRVERGRKKVKKKYDEVSDELERVTGEKINKDELKKEVAAKQEEKEAKARERILTQKANVVIQIVSGINSIVKEWYQTSIDIQLNQMETMTRITSEGIRTIGSGINRVLSSSLKSITAGVQEGAYASANSGIDTSMQMQNYEMSKREQELSMENFAKTRRAEATASTVKTMSSVIGGVVGGAIGAAFSGGLATAIGASVGASVGNVIGSLADWYPTVIKNAAQLNEAQLKQLNETQRAALEVGTNMQKEIIQFSNEIETILGKNQTAAKNIQATTGINTSAMASNENILFNMQKMIGVTGKNGQWQHLNIGLEEMNKMQTSYSDITGRGIAFGLNDYSKQAQLGHVVGSQDLAVQLTAGMEIFNKSAAQGSDILFEMYKTANNMGISSRKYAKELVKNMKLAEKYSFKNGVQGLMKMAAWAQKTRFNMDSFESTLQKVSEGGLEGVLKMGAEFQVLGGNAAMAADPIAMMYERYADPEALAKRMHSMVKGYGSFNKKTGEVEVNGTDLMMAEQLAKVRGIPVNDVLNEIKQERKGEEINRVLGEGQYNEKQRALLAQKATYNVEKNKWEVVGADQKVHDINNLTDKDFEAMAMDHDQTMEEYVYDIMGNVERMAGTKREGEQITMENTREEWNKQVQARIEEDKRFYNDSSGVLKSLVTQNMQFATEMDKTNHETFEKSVDLFKTTNDIILNNAKDFAQTIADANTTLLTAIKMQKGETSAKDVINEMKGAEVRKRFRSGEKSNELYDLLKEHPEYRTSKQNPEDSLTIEQQKEIRKYDTRSFFGKLVQWHRDNNWKEGEEGDDATRYHEKALPSTTMISTAGGYNINLPKSTKDAVMSADGKPIYTKATEVTPINDGSAQIIQSDPNDTALFAKNGGPFDKLFNGVFGRINDIYKTIYNNSSSTNIPKIFSNSSKNNFFKNVNNDITSSSNENDEEYVRKLWETYKVSSRINNITNAVSKVTGIPIDDIKPIMMSKLGNVSRGVNTIGNNIIPNNIYASNVDKGSNKVLSNNMPLNNPTNINNSSVTNNNASNTMHFDTLKIEMSGNLELSSGGKSVDIIGELQNNPILMREFSRMFAQHISSAINGGRGKANLAIGSV